MLLFVIALIVRRLWWRKRGSELVNAEDSRVWLVTGAASGIGKVLVAELLLRGQRVVACDIDEGGLRRLSAESADTDNNNDAGDVSSLSWAGAWAKGRFGTALMSKSSAGSASMWQKGVLMVLKLDITSLDSWRDVIGAVERDEDFGKVDVHCNMAGVIAPGIFLDLPEDKWEHSLDFQLGVNVKGTALGSRVAVEHMQRCAGGEPTAARGIIVNTTSLASLIPMPGCATYGASKAAARSFSWAMSLELKKSHPNVRMVMVAPDAVRTPLLDAIHTAKTSEFAFTRPLAPADVVRAIVDDAVPNDVNEVWVPFSRGVLSVFLYTLFDTELLQKALTAFEVWGKWAAARYSPSTNHKKSD